MLVTRRVAPALATRRVAPPCWSRGVAPPCWSRGESHPRAAHEDAAACLSFVVLLTGRPSPRRAGRYIQRTQLEAVTAQAFGVFPCGTFPDPTANPPVECYLWFRSWPCAPRRGHSTLAPGSAWSALGSAWSALGSARSALGSACPRLTAARPLEACSAAALIPAPHSPPRRTHRCDAARSGASSPFRSRCSSCKSSPCWWTRRPVPTHGLQPTTAAAASPVAHRRLEPHTVDRVCVDGQQAAHHGQDDQRRARSHRTPGRAPNSAPVPSYHPLVRPPRPRPMAPCGPRPATGAHAPGDAGRVGRGEAALDCRERRAQESRGSEANRALHWNGRAALTAARARARRHPPSQSAPSSTRSST